MEAYYERMRSGLALLITFLLAATTASAGTDAQQQGKRRIPVDLRLPRISGTPAVGKTLGGAGGTRSWSGRVATVSFQWQRCDFPGVKCLDASTEGDTVGDGLSEDGALATTTSTGPSFASPTCGTAYTRKAVAVKAHVGFGAHLAKASAGVSRSACASLYSADTHSPTAVGNLRATSRSTSSIAVAWDASTGVIGYGLYLDGALIAATTATTATVANLTCGTTHTLAVDAYDAAGNRSVKAWIRPWMSACPSPPATPSLLTGAHWGAQADLPTFKAIGYDFDVATLNPNDPSNWASFLDAAQANGLKLIVGGYPEPYSYDAGSGQWTISPGGVNLLHYLASRSSLVLALFVFNEPYFAGPNGTSSCGYYSAAQLRQLRAQIQAIWPGAKIYHDLGWPSEWAPGGDFASAYSCIGNRYADQTGVADYVGVYDYPFESSGYQKARGLGRLQKETSFVTNSMHATPVWLNQSHACCGTLVFPTPAEILDWNCAVRNALPAGSLISWYAWRQSTYSDTLARHSEDWPLTTAAGCG